MKLGIDATNLGGGGGATHLIEILNSLSLIKYQFGIQVIFVFSSNRILDQISNSSLIVKVSFPELNQSLLQRIRFQFFDFDAEIRKRCDILFSVSGDYIGNFKPVIGMSRNMLLFERDIWFEIRRPTEILRFWINFLKQKLCFNNSDGIIFISNYAQQYANKTLDIKNKEQIVIAHGLAPQFRGLVQIQNSIENYNFGRPFNFLYVSTVHVYKNQWNVVKAISNLRKKGFPLSLTLIGGVIFEPAGRLLKKTIEEEDPKGDFIFSKGHIPYVQISEAYKNASGIIFASHCENMPNILMESMASGVPIICSNKSPMPEFLKGNGFYFNPKNIGSLEKAIELFLDDPVLREINANNNIEEVKKYSWEKTATETFGFIQYIYKKFYND